VEEKAAITIWDEGGSIRTDGNMRRYVTTQLSLTSACDGMPPRARMSVHAPHAPRASPMCASVPRS
jgi:hypothetical protein